MSSTTRAIQRQDEIGMKTGSMKRLFLHIYLWVLVAAFIGIGVSQWLVQIVYERDESGFHRNNVEATHPIILEQLLEAPRDQWRVVLDKWEPLTLYELDIVGIDDPFWEREKRAKPDGDTLAYSFHSNPITDYLEAAYRIPGTDQVLLYDMVDPWSLTYQTVLYLGPLITLLVMGVVTYILVKPIYRASQRLRFAAQRYAEGELDQRIDVKGNEPFEDVSHQFNRMADEIQNQIHEQEVMTHAISHELKTPITRLRLALDMAVASRDTTELRELVAGMDQDVNDMDALTARLLALAKLTYTRDALPLERLPLADIIQEEANRIQPFKPDIKITLSGDTCLHCFGHKDHLGRVFHNLLSNGQRHASQVVNVDLGVEGDTILVTVDDDGPGIPADQREQVFIPFARVDSSRTRQTGGCGLGLAIVRQSVLKQRGSIGIEAGPLGGARFALRFHKA